MYRTAHLVLCVLHQPLIPQERSRAENAFLPEAQLARYSRTLSPCCYRPYTSGLLGHAATDLVVLGRRKHGSDLILYGPEIGQQRDALIDILSANITRLTTRATLEII